MLNVKSFVPLPLLRLLYRASDGVLANSGHEPFGLVGLEAMAAGAVAYTGGTGEDYAVHMENAIVLETADPEEAAWYVRLLRDHPALSAQIAAAGRRTARRFVWPRVVENLAGKVALLAARQGAPAAAAIDPPPSPVTARPVLAAR